MSQEKEMSDWSTFFLSEKAIVVIAVLHPALAYMNTFTEYTDVPTEHTEPLSISTRSPSAGITRQRTLCVRGRIGHLAEQTSHTH